jgi:hypothetical protein
MSIRHVARTVARSLAVVAAAGAVSIVSLAGPAGAANVSCSPSVTTGCVDATATVPQAGYTPGTPFSSGQQINVTVPANSIFSSTTNLSIVECAAPDGVLPTSSSSCDGNTIQGPTLKANSDGSVNLFSKTDTYYTVPDFTNLGETSGTSCNLSNSCVLYIGTNYNDFTQPHVWSSVFNVNPGDGSDSGANPGDGTPEVPLAVMLPLASLALIAGALVVRRRQLAQV